MAVMPGGDKHRVDFLLRQQLGDACRCVGEIELPSIVNGKQAIRRHKGMEFGPGFRQRRNQDSPGKISSPNATYYWLGRYAEGPCRAEQNCTPLRILIRPRLRVLQHDAKRGLAAGEDGIS